ncbi:hypothetical protein OHB26_05230 [Nocardia sp. NBC_01503]|uniref:alcohol dehydrogenase catalytic domain-containing protein n=1 Tax=Nocardia sp. NBC_01503 TaxID=2975997 RepID=UPI002E7BDA6F|nr:hypothetical protein [Nocardia sp. NBC_01503]WTL33639.1 hypothetical protein OHB26_05230 [Nocardia sp. NBC_01503]
MKAQTATADDRVITRTDVPEPEPADHEAVIAVEAFSVNRGDYFALTGVYGTEPIPGRVPGQDVAGRIVRAAADGSGPVATTHATTIDGAPFTNHVAIVFRISNGRIAEAREYFDTAYVGRLLFGPVRRNR